MNLTNLSTLLARCELKGYHGQKYRNTPGFRFESLAMRWIIPYGFQYVGNVTTERKVKTRNSDAIEQSANRASARRARLNESMKGLK
jgi:hypothetical protein